VDNNTNIYIQPEAQQPVQAVPAAPTVLTAPAAPTIPTVPAAPIVPAAPPQYAAQPVGAPPVQPPVYYPPNGQYPQPVMYGYAPQPVMAQPPVVVQQPVMVMQPPVPVRQEFDSSGREKAFMFLRRMNSVGNALLVDILLQTVAAVQVVLIGLIVWMFSNMTSLESMAEMFSSNNSDATLETIMLLGVIANAVAMPLGHILAGYMHSVRNNFTMGSVMSKPRWRGSGFWGATVLALGATYAWTFIYMICGWIMPGSFFDGGVFTANSFEGAELPRIIMTALYVCVGAPLTEEFLFRGVLLKSMSKYGVPFAVFASSVLFGLIHGNIYQTPFAALVGVVLAYVAVRSGSIWPGVIIHMIVNCFATARDLTLSLVSSEYADAVHYGFFGLAGVLVLGSVIILCTGAKRIKWQPIDAESNRLLLPAVESRVRAKPLWMLIAVSLLVVILIYTFSILSSCGITFGLENLIQTYSGY